MYAYSNSAFRMRVVVPEGERIEEGTLYLAAHREETDVPLICGSYYFAARVWRQAAPRLHFAARDDLFEPGFFAGFPPDQPRAVRRALHGISIRAPLGRVHVHPITSATTMKLAQALAAIEPSTSIEIALPIEFGDMLRARALELGRDEPETVGDVQGPDYVDLLWKSVGVDDLPAEPFRQVWAARATAATGDLRQIVSVIRSGEALLLFPEGRPSPDGTLGPLQRGMGAILRRGRPEQLRVFGLAYDPLTIRRTKVVLSVGSPVEPPRSREPDLLPALARGIAVTTGQVVSTTLLGRLADGASVISPAEVEATLVQAIIDAREAGRVVDPDLEDRISRRRALSDALRAAEQSGLVTTRDPRSIELNRESILRDPIVARLASEAGSARREAARARV